MSRIWIGTALIREGHRLAGEMGFSYSLVLGSETYYPRMGYVPAAEYGIEVPEGFPSQKLMRRNSAYNVRQWGKEQKKDEIL